MVSLGMSGVPCFAFGRRPLRSCGPILARQWQWASRRSRLQGRNRLRSPQASRPSPRALARAGYPEPRIRETGYRDAAAHHRRPAGQRRRRGQRCGASSRRCSARTCRPRRCSPPEFDALRGLRPVAPEAGLRALAVRAGGQRRARSRQPARGRRGSDRRSWSGSRASAAGRRRSTCCSPKGGPTSGRRATSRCRPGIGKILGLEERPSEKDIRELAENVAAAPRRGRDLHLALLQQPGALTAYACRSDNYAVCISIIQPRRRVPMDRCLATASTSAR